MCLMFVILGGRGIFLGSIQHLQICSVNIEGIIQKGAQLNLIVLEPVQSFLNHDRDQTRLGSKVISLSLFMLENFRAV